MNKISGICIAIIVSWRVSQAVYRSANHIVTKCQPSCYSLRMIYINSNTSEISFYYRNQWSHCIITYIITYTVNTLRPRQSGHHFSYDILEWIFLNENVLITIKISFKFVPRGPINNLPVLVQIINWHQPGDKSLSDLMMVRLPTHIYVTWTQWVNGKGCHCVCFIIIRVVKGYQNDASFHQFKQYIRHTLPWCCL